MSSTFKSEGEKLRPLWMHSLVAMKTLLRRQFHWRREMVTLQGYISEA